MNREDKELMVNKIRAQYTEKEASEKQLDRLRELDAQVKRPANAFAYVWGTIGSLIMGAGMSYAMEVIGEKKQIRGVVMGIIGMLMMGGTYPAYKKILASRKEQYGKEILDLSEKIMDME